MTTRMPTAVDRRAFLQMSGALVVSFSAASILDAADVVQGPFDTRRSHVDPTQLDSWLAVGADGGVTAYTGKCEFGQGMYTAQIQLVAEELSVPVSRVKLIQCDTSICPDQGTTSGSQSTPTNFNERNLAQAAATAREALLRLASQRLGVPVDRLSASDGVVGVKGDAGKRVSYGELVGGKRFDVTVNAHAPRTAVADWKVMGTPVPRVDMTEMATGTFEFVHNVRVPGMLHGRVVRPASVGAAVASVDEASVRGMPGLVKVVVRKNFVGVVCEKQWQAIQAAAKLKVVWTAGPGLPAQHDFYDHLRKQPARASFTTAKLSESTSVQCTMQYVRLEVPSKRAR